MRFDYIILLFLYYCVLCRAYSADYDDTNDPGRQKRTFRALLQQRRTEQVQAVKKVMSMPDREKVLKMLGEKFLEIFTEGRKTLEASGQPPDGDLLSNKESMEALGSVITNTAFLGEFLLRMPDMVHKYLDANYPLAVEVKWGVSFCNATGLLDPVSDKMLHLMAQELNIIEKDANYHNPYRDPSFEEVTNIYPGMPVDESSSASAATPAKKKKKPPVKKGPRMSRSRNEF